MDCSIQRPDWPDMDLQNAGDAPTREPRPPIADRRWRRVLAVYREGWVRIGRYLLLHFFLFPVLLPVFLLGAMASETHVLPFQLAGVALNLVWFPFAFAWACRKSGHLETPSRSSLAC